MWVVLAGCARGPAEAPTDAPCDRLESCLVGCGEGRDADCVALTAQVGALPWSERGVARSVAEAGCVAGAVAGCTLAGELWLQHDGEDREASTGRAAGWLERGCVGRSPRACARFGALLAEGDGVPADPHRAEGLWTWSCDRGEAEGCRNAASRAAGGDRPVTALPLYQRACDLGDPRGCSGLAELYDLGRGVGADEARARALYDRACAGGDPLGCVGRDAIDDRVHPVQRLAVKVFEVGYAGPEVGRAARSEAEARRLAQSAVHHLGRGVPLAEVASAYGDRSDGGGVVRDQTLVRVKTPSALQRAAFALPPGGATWVPVPGFGYLVVYRPR